MANDNSKDPDYHSPDSSEEIESTLPIPPKHQRPKQIGPYRILELLGSGGMGDVYLAEQLKPIKRRVAIKVIKVGMDTKEVIARFESERQALAMMNHPNVAKIFEAGCTETGRPYFVMEHVAGEPITTYCDRHRLDIRSRLEVFIPVCLAIHHAHQKGIIHRDIKPGNVLVAVQDGQPVPKVIDFGVAKATEQRLTERTLFTEQGRIIGTPAYMSPEQAEMTGLNVDATSDVYSLGVLLFELLVGTPPFNDKDLRKAGLVEMHRVIREVEPPVPSKMVSSLGEKGTILAELRHLDFRRWQKQLHGELDWITLRALEKDRTHRYQSARGLYNDITRFLMGEVVVAGRPSTIYRLKKLANNNKKPVLLFVAVSLSALIGSIVSRNLTEIKPNDTAARYAIGLAITNSITFVDNHFIISIFTYQERYLPGEILERSPNVKRIQKISDFTGGYIPVNYSISPNGERIVCQVVKVMVGSDSFSNLWEADLKMIPLVWNKLTEDQYYDIDPVYGPDSRTVYFASYRDDSGPGIFAINPLSGEGISRVVCPEEACGYPEVNYFSNKLVFCSTSRERADWKIWQCNFDGSDLQTTGTGLAPKMAPNDNSMIVSYVNRGLGEKGFKLFGIKEDNELVPRMNYDQYNYVHPSWSPDGKAIVYSRGKDKVDLRNGDGNYDIWLSDGSPQSPYWLTTNIGKDIKPVFGQDGKTIYFLSRRDNSWQIYRIIIDPKY